MPLALAKSYNGTERIELSGFKETDKLLKH